MRDRRVSSAVSTVNAETQVRFTPPISTSLQPDTCDSSSRGSDTSSGLLGYVHSYKYFFNLINKLKTKVSLSYSHSLPGSPHGFRLGAEEGLKLSSHHVSSGTS